MVIRNRKLTDRAGLQAEMQAIGRGSVTLRKPGEIAVDLEKSLLKPVIREQEREIYAVKKEFR